MTGEMAEDAAPKRRRHERSKVWRRIVASTVAGIVVIGAGVAIWRGPGVIPGGGGGGICGTITPAQTLVTGFDIDNTAQNAIVLESIRVTRQSNIAVSRISAVDRSDGGVGADALPDASADTVMMLHRSRPIPGFLIAGKQEIEVLLELRRQHRGERGIIDQFEITYREQGKPFEYSASVEPTFVVASDDKKCGHI